MTVPGGDDTYHLALYKSLYSGGILHLLAYRHLVALFDQSCDICFGTVERNSAHRGALCLAAVAPGERKLKHARRDDGIIKKHLVKVAETVKKQEILILIFYFKVLLHHRSHEDILPFMKLR